MSSLVLSPEEIRKREFWEPCQSKEELYLHIKTFLNIDLPRYTIDEFSTSNPLDFIWSIYEVMLTNQGSFRHVVACSRNSMKTLGSAIIHFYALIHFRRDCCQMAAIKSQSGACIKYIDKFLMIPEVAGYSNINNQQEKILTNLPANSFTDKSEAKLLVIVATLKGTNSARASLLINDEIELIEPDILSEAANIADPTMREGFDPISIYLSSRKFAGGPLQGMIDDAEASVGEENPETQLHKWSLCDFMQQCPESLHQPSKSRVRALINRDTLEVLWGKEAEEADKTNAIEVNAYHGCVTCGAFVVCQSRATKQPGTSPSLRTPKFVGGRIRDVKDPKKVIAQILNWKPESTGLVYPTFTPSLHIKDAVAAYKWISGGIVFNPMGLTEDAYQRVVNEGDLTEKKLVVPTKRDLYKLMVKNGWKIHWGVDWGYTDPASVVICGFDKKTLRAFVLHAEMKTGHSNQDWAEYICTTYGKTFAPDLICPDMADGAAPTYFAKFKLQCRDTKPSRIETGVSFVRSLLWNVSTQTPNFCILDDRSNACLVEEMQQWTHLRIPTGYDFDKFDPDAFTHTNDALRYLLDPFIEESDVVLRAYQKKAVTMSELFEKAKDASDTEAQIALAKKQMEDYFAKEHGLSNVFNENFRVPFAIPLATLSASTRAVQNHIDDNTDKRKGGFFYRF